MALLHDSAEDDPHRQRGQDREIRVPSLVSAETVLRWYPRGDRLLAQTDRDIASAPEAALLLPPVPDFVLRPVLAVDSTGIPCGHRVAPSTFMMDRDPEPMLAARGESRAELRAALSRQLCVAKPRNITDIPAVSRLDLPGNGSLSLTPDFHHGPLAWGSTPIGAPMPIHVVESVLDEVAYNCGIEKVMPSPSKERR